jgi:hypothetical protein
MQTPKKDTRTAKALAALREEIRETVSDMRGCAKSARSGRGFAHPELQPLRDASAHAEEFWAMILEEALKDNLSMTRSKSGTRRGGRL